ncbi:MAG: MBL fold metallo-hydrolase [Candidatus Colwellbacteria bacterium]|nr:MBL fold metallo-hydrolase [Candidatus Colwellbacteria bacterium]
MVVSLSPPGVKCQVGDFVMLVDPAVALATAGKPAKGNLILYTEASLPLNFPLPPEVVAGAGEYEISGVRVKGINLDKETRGRLLRTVYSAELEGIRLAFLGELGGESISEILDKLGTIDILFLSASGSASVATPAKGAGDAKQIATLIKQVDPKIIIPVGDKTVKLLSGELGQKVKAEEKLVIKRKDLDKEQIVGKLVWLKS